jgi:hypothetical protein
MAQATAREAAEAVLEQGSVTFFYRPRVEEHHPDDLDDVQRLILVLSPDGGLFERAISIGRKRVPRSARRDRFWGFVDLVLTPYDMNAALGAQVYGTKTRGLRHLPAAQQFATGTYELSWHGGHAHLRWRIEDRKPDPVAADVDLERHADYIVTVMNPDPEVWGLIEPPDLQSQLFDDLELHVTIPTPFPPALQEQFRNRKYAQIDSSEWLDHPGAELVFVGSGD